MPVELVYTSSPRGLHPGSSDYCIVRETMGMDNRLRRKLESLSSYEWLTASSISAIAQNPPRLIHSIHRSSSGRMHLLSSLVPAAPDHTGRSNHVAHHIGLEGNQLPGISPIALLTSPRLFRKQWTANDRCEFSDEVPGLASAMNGRLSGISANGLATEIADFVRNSSSPLYIVYSKKTDVTPLLGQVLTACTDPWKVTFATYFDPQQVSVDCQIRCVVKESRYFATNGAQLNSTQPVITLKSSADGAGNDQWRALLTAQAGRKKQTQRTTTGDYASYDSQITLPGSSRPSPRSSGSASHGATSHGATSGSGNSGAVPQRPSSQYASRKRIATDVAAVTRVEATSVRRSSGRVLAIASVCLVLFCIAAIGFYLASDVPENTTQATLVEISVEQVENRTEAYRQLRESVESLHTAVSQRDVDRISKLLVEDDRVEERASLALAGIRDFELEAGYELAPPGSPFQVVSEKAQKLKMAWRELWNKGALIVSNSKLNELLTTNIKLSEVAIDSCCPADSVLQNLAQDASSSEDMAEHQRLKNLLSWFVVTNDQPVAILSDELGFLNQQLRPNDNILVEVIANELLSPFLRVDSSNSGQIVVSSKSLTGFVSIGFAKPDSDQRLQATVVDAQQLSSLLGQIGVSINLGHHKRSLLFGTAGSAKTALIRSEMMEADSGQNWTVPTEFHPASAEFSVTTAKRCVLESGNKSISLKVLKSSDQSILFAANEDQILAHINRMVGAANKNDAQQIDESLMKQLLSSFQPTEPLIAVTLDNNTNTIGWRYNEDYFATWFQREAFALYKQCHDPQLADKPNNLWMVLADSEGIDASVISDGFEMAARPLTDARPFYETYFECRDSAKTTNEADISNDENVTREEKLNRKRLQDKIEAAEQVLGNKETVSKAMSFDYATLKSLTPEQTELLAEIFSTQSDAAWERLATMELQTPAISDSLPEESGTSADNAAAPDQTAAFYAVRKAVGDRIRKSQFRAQQMQLLMKLQAAASLLDSTGTQISLEARLSGIQLWTKHSSWSRFTADGNWEPLQDHPISSEDRILLFESI